MFMVYNIEPPVPSEIINNTHITQTTTSSTTYMRGVSTKLSKIDLTKLTDNDEVSDDDDNGLYDGSPRLIRAQTSPLPGKKKKSIDWV